MELITALGTGVTMMFTLAWYYLIIIAVVFLVAIVFSNDDEVGAESFIFLAIFGAIIYSAWGLMSIGEGIFAIIYYLILGSIWSIFNYTRIIRKEIQDSKEQGYDPGLEHFLTIIPKNRIVRWIAYWPFSILNFVVADVIVKVFTKITDLLGNTYSRITRHFYNKIMGK